MTDGINTDSGIVSKKWIIVSEDEYALSNSKIDLNMQEGEMLLTHAALFKKFLAKSKFNYQIALSTGRHKGREIDLYRAMDVCDEISKSIDSIEEGFIKYKQKQDQIKPE